MEEAEPPTENVDPKRFSWLKFEPHPLPLLWERRGAVPSRGDVIEAKIVDASGRAAEVMLEALEVEPAQEAGIFTRVVCSGVVDPELANHAVQVLEVCHVDPFHLPSSTCDCDGDSDWMLQKNKSVRTRNDVTAAVASSC